MVEQNRAVISTSKKNENKRKGVKDSEKESKQVTANFASLSSFKRSVKGVDFQRISLISDIAMCSVSYRFLYF